MSYSLNKIYEGFREQMKDRNSMSFSQKMNKDMHDSVSAIQFECKELAEYIGELYNDGNENILYSKAAEMDADLGNDFFVDFEEKYNITKPYTFNEMKYFKSAEFTYDQFAFPNAPKYLKEITVPGIDYQYDEEDKQFIFKNYPLEKVTIEKGFTSILNFMFSHCIYLKEIDIPESVTSIESQAFEECTNLEKIDLSDNIESFGWTSFYNCLSLEHIHVPEDLAEIPTSCFSRCSTLRDITIPESVKIIKARAFFGCKGLKKVIFKGKTSFEKCSSSSDNIFNSNKTIYFIPEKYKTWYLEESGIDQFPGTRQYYNENILKITEL